jgi:hypothetical protein
MVRVAVALPHFLLPLPAGRVYIFMLLNGVTGIAKALDVRFLDDGINGEASFFIAAGSMVQDLNFVFAYQISHSLTAAAGNRDAISWHRNKPSCAQSKGRIPNHYPFKMELSTNIQADWCNRVARYLA